MAASNGPEVDLSLVKREVRLLPITHPFRRVVEGEPDRVLPETFATLVRLFLETRGGAS
jgi:hypothetical protein